MAKKRKTRAQKEIIGTRRVQTVSTTSPETPGSPTSYQYTYQSTGRAAQPSIRSTAISTTSYAFVIHDLRRTFILTLSIIAIQLILFFVTK